MENTVPLDRAWLDVGVVMDQKEDSEERELELPLSPRKGSHFKLDGHMRTSSSPCAQPWEQPIGQLPGAVVKKDQ
jgi:hypothetical protein